MRAQTKAIGDVRSGDLAVLGVPFEDTSAPYAGQSLAPRALRETSVLFAVLIGVVFFHERADRGKLVAAGLIVGGIILTRL